jgi:hypothetical protein
MLVVTEEHRMKGEFAGEIAALVLTAQLILVGDVGYLRLRSILTRSRLVI